MASSVAAPAAPRALPTYPESKPSDTADVLHGTTVPDPFRHLEEVGSDETKAWVAAQVDCTQGYFESAGIAGRASEIAQKLTSVWDYDKVYPPHKEGEWYYFAKKVGTANQPVVMRAREATLEGLASAEPFLNVNEDYPSGTVALSAIAYSDDGKYVAYGLSKGGSDWFQIRVRRTSDGVDLEDIVPWARYSSISWRKDGAGFFYNRYRADPGVTLPNLRREGEPAPTLSDPRADAAASAPAAAGGGGVEAGMETGANTDQMVYYHELGTHPSSDRLVYQAEDPEWIMGVEVTDDGKYLLVCPGSGCDHVNRVFVADISGEAWAAWLAAADEAAAASPTTGAVAVGEGPQMPLRRLVDDFRGEFEYLTNEGTLFWFKTNLDAPRGRVITLTLPGADADDVAWLAAGFDAEVAVPESPTGRGEVLESACITGDSGLEGARPVLILRYLADVVSSVRIYDPSNTAAGFSEVALPAPGSASRTSARRDASEVFFAFESLVHAGSVLRLGLADAAPLLTPGASIACEAVLHTAVPGHDPNDYVSEQSFFESKDGTKVPLFLCRHKDAALPARTLLYGYGGFTISLPPYFSAARTVWMKELGGVYALANIRGGGEYGEEWHRAGSLRTKQNTFDDFCAAAEHLQRTGVTTPALTAIQGGSNGGLLTLACSLQRPELFGAVISQVPVADMLRFHRFTIGSAWCTDYGNAEKSEEDFRYMLTYSPLHNVKPVAEGGQTLPATLICTADHDDRVVPLHTYKMLATLQSVAGASPGQTRPLLGRIEVDAGHGAGKPLSKVIQEVAELYAFMEHELAA